MRADNWLGGADIGSASPDGSRGPAVYQGERDDAHAAAYLSVGGRKRALGRVDEVSVRSIGPIPIEKGDQEEGGGR
jgi:hypothetical protein